LCGYFHVFRGGRGMLRLLRRSPFRLRLSLIYCPVRRMGRPAGPSVA
jgi:hypothetical protein